MNGKVDDLISRQALLESIERISVKGNVLDDDWVYRFIQEFPSAHQWIPCSERLPEPIAPSQRREWFITSNQYGGVACTCYEFEASPFKVGWQTDMTILAWMPLPEPYEAERKEE